MNFYVVEVRHNNNKMYDYKSLSKIPFPKPLKVILDDFV